MNRSTVYLQADSGDKIPLSVLIVPHIAAPIQNTCSSMSEKLPYLRGLKLAHPISNEDSFTISLLIGADHYWDIVKDEIVRGNSPTAMNSRIGYLLSGPLNTGTRQGKSHMLNVLIDRKYEEHDIEKFWKLESLGIHDNDKLSTEKQNISRFASDSISFDEGRYVAKLPWIEDCPVLPTNEMIVRKRTERVVSRLSNEPELLQVYGKIITEQERRGFIEKVEQNQETTPERIHYIPHHPVKKDSSTTPIRIVYDCSCKENSRSPSLNDCLYSYPPITQDLTEILTRFRTQRYAITTDIEKAFLQVGLHPKDRDVTRFYWLSDPSDVRSPFITYRFKSVLFGATCSPFILNATLLKHFDCNPSPTATRLTQDLYVDNVLSSFTTESEMINFYHCSRRLLLDGGFNLRSWNSNSTKLRELASGEKILDEDHDVKILGLRWNVTEDQLQFPKIDLDACESNLTKREVLRQSSRIFDPLGILSPVTVKAKILMQSLWKRNFDWDECLPDDISDQWTTLIKDLENATTVKLPRLLHEDGVSTENGTLHVFTDSSIQAYGACVYLVQGKTSTLVMAKSRVAPVKPTTLPRLELMGALVGAKLANHVSGILGITNVTFWSDSQIVLSWIQASKPLKQFVENRVTEIRELTSGHQWRYCPTESNPADYLTRGINSIHFIGNLTWFKGPKWLTENEETWPKWERNSTVLTTLSDNLNDETKSLTETTDGISSFHEVINIERFSSYRKALRVMAYVNRFIKNCKSKEQIHKVGPLDSEELQQSSRELIRNVQQCVFGKEMTAIREKGSTNTSIPIIRQLRLYIDEQGLLRSAGRIDNADISYSAKYPILLPSIHPLTDLVIKDAHINQLHSGVNGTITLIQQTFWIPRIRQRVKAIVTKCLPCRKFVSRPYTAPDPPPLPKDRLTDEPPFSVTGVDFTGALHVKQNNRDAKTYICLFTCASTRAVHLEIVRDLTEDSFILAFRRFSSRRSIPRIMISDNALTFKSASREITLLSQSESLQEKLNSTGTVWKFIPNRAPWYGGWWERLIGLTKTALKKSLGKAYIDIDFLQTLVTEIECTLNDRPLTYVSTDVTDADPLTPSHLLYGRRLKTLPYPSEDAIHQRPLTKTSATKRARKQKEILEHFQTRWKKEYLTSLREFQRAYGDNRQSIQVGDYVQIHDDTSRTLWNTGIVEDLVRGGDGIVRSATVRTRFGITIRPIVKLYPLELNILEDGSRKLRRSARLEKKTL